MTAARLDQALVERGFVRSRAQAKEAIAAGRVLVAGQPQTKPAVKVESDQELVLVGDSDPYVGRAAHKLVAALEEFDEVATRIAGASALDVGASTGGFTQVLLERGASHVVALDVGHGQLAPSLVADERVTNLEGTNIRDVRGLELIGGRPADIIVSDLSFISLTLVVDAMARLLAPQGDMVVLVKPQFEVGRERLGRTGVVTSKEQRREAITKVLAAAQTAGLEACGLAWSPMVGSTGNHEYLAWLRPAGSALALSPNALEERKWQLTENSAP